LVAGADPSLPARNGLTAAQVAEAAGHAHLLPLLKQTLQ
jgi:hypothetical protein